MTMLEEKLQKQWELMKGAVNPAIIDLDQDNQDNINTLPVLDVVPDFAISLAQAKERVQMLQLFVENFMTPGVDYGYIPGCQKPSLMKSGCEKLCEIFGFSKQIEVIDRVVDWEKGMFAYEVKAILTNKRTGLVEAEGLGSCNSMEKKYRQQDGYTISNTVLKMAKKRALVDAVLSATRSSGLFTQDVEDMDLSPASPAKESSQLTPAMGTKPVNTPIKPEKEKGATDKQLNKIYALTREIGMPPETARQLLHDRFNVNNSKEMDIRQASDFIKYLLELKG